MRYVDYLRECRYSDATAYHQFISESGRHPASVFAFFEGGDDVSFYGNFIERRHPGRWRDVRCGNRDGVARALDKIVATNRGVDRCLFFIDRDHTELLGGIIAPHRQLFTTRFYSFENYLISPEMFIRVWTDLFKLPQGNPEFESVSQQFARAGESFRRVMLPITAFLLAVRDLKIACSLQGLNLESVISYDSKQCRFKFVKGFKMAKVADACCGKKGVVVPAAAVRRFAARIRGMDSKVWLRGKWELWSFVKFIQGTHPYLAAQVKNHKFSAPIHNGNAADFLGPRVGEPADLKTYFDSL